MSVSVDGHGLVAVLDNGVLAWGLAACGLAQFSKLLIELVVHRRWRPEVLVETGGMPSSHSALLTGTAAGLGWQVGFDDPLFALAATMCFVVLYDASGVRRAAGLTAARVNLLQANLRGDGGSGGEANPPGEPEEKPLKENLGHTRLEVLVGSLIGPLVALPGLVLLGSPLHLVRALFAPVA
ncbi:divergent PAP2 family protein [Cyanobium sp. HWJ4-Hawea]|uniref:divergent PAP2 family protein n=1 Tax=unclassified Cyanobium TaxID=2627006 RepID=UPI0020CD70CC|nr:MULTISPECIES: divergent PAP2 family protein [unclassified Cyanobium]MCP9774209.1 divergent PAP2 family protein [Cyanobium sp. WAJ14-Wanaka]MCP9809379.1 divergent PAP2 family protein [Cyanobium sp. HWJ4-Hawea]